MRFSCSFCRFVSDAPVFIVAAAAVVVSLVLPKSGAASSFGSGNRVMGDGAPTDAASSRSSSVQILGIIWRSRSPTLLFPHDDVDCNEMRNIDADDDASERKCKDGVMTDTEGGDTVDEAEEKAKAEAEAETEAEAENADVDGKEEEEAADKTP